MAWKIPAHPEKRHPRKKFVFTRDTLFHLHVVLRASPREISRVHQMLMGVTIRPHGVRNYLKVHGFYKPPGELEGNVYPTNYRRLESFLRTWRRKELKLLTAFVNVELERRKGMVPS